MNRVLAIIQARMGSNRLPGKVMKDIGGETMLARVVKRTKRAELLDNVVVATTVDPRDDVIVNECQRLDVPVCRGKESDVLDRYYQAALLHRSDTIVRITSDSPLIDPAVVDKIISAFLSENPDYASNVVERTYPMGLDTEVMSMSALKRAWEEARQAYERVFNEKLDGRRFRRRILAADILEETGTRRGGGRRAAKLYCFKDDAAYNRRA